MNEILKKDLVQICNAEWIDFNKLSDATVFVTGATGLIGYTLVNALLALGNKIAVPPHVIALVRNPDKAKMMFSGYTDSRIRFIKGDVASPVNIEDKVDYIIHAASQTSSKAFVEEPVEVIRTAIEGTINMLELAREKQVQSFIYFSSMEVYGSPDTDEKIAENHSTNLDTMSVRTSYPEAKRMCEALCTAYHAEYGVPAKVIRLTQTFGPGVKYNDGRVFAEFARCVLEKKDIVLHTKGETKRNYLYTADAVSAILTVLLHGEPGEAYNAANEETYCSIYEMAEMVADECANGKISVRIEIADENSFGFAPVLKMNLDTSKIRSLGWKARTSLSEMFIVLCKAMKQN